MSQVPIASGIARAVRLTVLAVLMALAPSFAPDAQEPGSEPVEAAPQTPTAADSLDFDFDEADAAAAAAAEEEEEEESEDDEDEEFFDEDGKEIEELVVTGQSTAGLSDLNDANSVTSFDARELEALGISGIADLSEFTPNLEIISANPTSPTFFIRGVGLSDFNANSTGAVAVFLDDVALNAPSLQSGLVFDVARINVLKGPQGTGPNRNASAGAIKTYSRPPSNEFGGNLRGSYGNYDFIDLEGGVDVPLIDDVLKTRTSFRFMRRRGTASNRCGDAPADGREVRDPLVFGSGSICGEYVRPLEESDLPVHLRSTVNDMLAAGARMQINYTPDLWSMNWMLNGHMTYRDQLAPLGQALGTGGVQRFQDGSPDIQGILGGLVSTGYKGKDVLEMVTKRRDELRDDGLPFSVALDQANLEVADELAKNLDIRPYVGDYNRTGQLRNITGGVFLRGDIPIGDAMQFSTISAYDSYNRYNDQDIDSTPDELFEVINDDEGWQFTQDLRVRGEQLEWMSWDAGAYYLTETIDSEVETFTADSGIGGAGISDRGYEQTLHSWAAYASVDIDFWDDLKFTGGLRYNWELKKMHYGLLVNTFPREANESQSWSAPTWSLRLTYAFSDEIEIYGKYGRGWKSGHYNAVGNLVEPGIGFADPETLDAWEAGFTAAWFDRKVGLNSSFFYYRYQDYQVFTFNQGFGVTPELIITNANDAENYGAEVDLTLNPWDEMLGMVRFGWLESRFLDFTQENVIETPGPNGSSIGVPVLIDYTGNRLINSPQFQLTFMAQYDLEIGRFGRLIPRYDSTWKSASYFDASEGVGPPNTFQGQPFLPPNTLGQEPYWLHNARLTYVLPNMDIEISGWVRNFMGETYKAGGFNASGFANLIVAFAGDPRTGGVDVSVRF